MPVVTEALRPPGSSDSQDGETQTFWLSDSKPDNDFVTVDVTKESCSFSWNATVTPAHFLHTVLRTQARLDGTNVIVHRWDGASGQFPAEKVLSALDVLGSDLFNQIYTFVALDLRGEARVSWQLLPTRPILLNPVSSPVDRKDYEPVVGIVGGVVDMKAVSTLVDLTAPQQVGQILREASGEIEKLVERFVNRGSLPVSLMAA